MFYFRKESSIRHLSWHPKAEKFALALRNDTVQIHYINKYELNVF